MIALQQAVGPAKFEDLMSTVDVETMQQVKEYLRTFNQWVWWIDCAWKGEKCKYGMCVKKGKYESTEN